MVDGELLSLPPFSINRSKNLFSGRIIVFDLQVHERADPGESVSKRGKQGAIAEAIVRECLDPVKKLLDFTFNEMPASPASHYLDR